MKIWCSEKEKKQLIRILAKDEASCLFSNYICFREDCEKCLEEQIEWHIFRIRVHKKD